MALQTIGFVSLAASTTTPADATARREHAAITQDVASQLGITTPLSQPFRQIRIAVTGSSGSAGNTANFTVASILAGTNQVAIFPNSGTLQTDGGIYKLLGSNTLPSGTLAQLWNQAPSSTLLNGAAYGASFMEPLGGKSFKETVETGTANLLIFAPHGGSIELGTSDELATAKSRLIALGTTPAVWDAQGIWGNNQTYQRWHITSGDINPASYPGLKNLVKTYATFPHAFAFHGFSWNEAKDSFKLGIVIGGRASLGDKLTVMNEIEAAVGTGVISFHIADGSGDRSFPGTDGDLAAFSGLAELRGVSADNIVNRLSPAGGIQIEQSRGVRETTLATHVATSVADALHSLI
jgi:phage replication-related protein YjqB (UPF0714/DUF867 family)